MLNSLYQNIVLKYPKVILSALMVFMVVMVTFAMKLEIDASSETLLLEGDKDLAFSRVVGKRFASSEYLLVTYTAKDDLLNEKNIKNIEELGEKLKTVHRVESITSLVNVPLLESSDKPVSEMLKEIPTIKTPGIDKERVRTEFLNSAIYSDNLVSSDFKTTGIMANLERDEKYFSLIAHRDSFVKLKKERALSAQEEIEFEKAQIELKQYRDKARELIHNSILKTRAIIAEFEQTHPDIKLHLGGVDMIADDMMEFVKYDLQNFGILIVVLLIVVMYILFREIRWVLIPLFICFISIVITSGFLGLFGWEITIVSSNFISLQLIMNMSLVVHLIIKYKELSAKNPGHEQKELVLKSALAMAKPSFFVVITTIAGFSSLVFSGILPVMNFGWMMSFGIVISLITTFILFPIVMILLQKRVPAVTIKEDVPISSKLANIAHDYRRTIFVGAIIVVVFAVTGATKLKVENSFIDYFKKDTEIYQGMALIDQKLGGTVPLDIVVTFKEKSDEVKSVEVVEEESDDMLDDFADEFALDEGEKEQYWFTEAKMDKIKQIHDYLDSLKPIGKVQSLATVGEIIKGLNDGEKADSFLLSVLYKELPEEFKRIILSPYVNVEYDQVRISTRLIDSMPGLERDKLLKKINKDLKDIVHSEYEEYRLSNLAVMYNNVLQSLFNSQIKTIGVVVLILFIMFLILFKNIKVALIAITVNAVPVSVIFGFMGWMGIPLDMMTITIAAISIGIAVDNTIHYIHRYKLEYNETKDLELSMFNSHGSIGRAMFYTSTIIMIGFSILVFSNFIPTIYFGLLTMVAMFMAIVADLLLLPALLLIFGL